MGNDDALPGYAVLVSTAMRAVDLSESGLSLDAPHIMVAEAKPGAGLRLDVLQAILEGLDRLSADGAAGYVSLESVLREVRQWIPEADEREVRFVCRFMDADRELLYRDPRDGIEKGTRSRTRLLHYEARRERVKLSDAGRLFLRIGNLSHQWLYEDKHAAKIVDALRLGEFADAARFALDHTRALRELTASIQHQIEAPLFDDMALAYVERREAINTMLAEAAKALLHANEALLAEPTVERLEDFNRRRGGVEVSLGRLRWLIEGAHRAMESASRTWARFLKRVQDGGRKQLGVVDLAAIADHLVAGRYQHADLHRLGAGVLGWHPAASFVSVSEVMDVLTPVKPIEHDKPLVIDTRGVDAPTAMQSWLDRHQDALRTALEAGPQTLSALIAGGVLGIAPLNAIGEITAAFGTFVVPDPLGIRDVVTVRVERHRSGGTAEGFEWTAPNMVLSLRTSTEDTDDTT